MPEIKTCAWCRHCDDMDGDRPAYWLCNKSRSLEVDLVSGKKQDHRKTCAEYRASTAKGACGRGGVGWESREGYTN